MNISTLKFTCLAMIFLVNQQLAFADKKKVRVIKSENSSCHVKEFAEADQGYRNYKVFKDKKVLYAPTSDQIAGVVFSPDGKYIAIGSTDIPSTDIGKENFCLVIVNCENEKVKGFINYKSMRSSSEEGPLLKPKITVWFTDKVYAMPKDWAWDFIPYEWGVNNEYIKFRYSPEDRGKGMSKESIFVFDKRDPLP